MRIPQQTVAGGGLTYSGFPRNLPYKSGTYIYPAVPAKSGGATSVAADVLRLNAVLVTARVVVSHVVFQNSSSVNTISFRGGLFTGAERVPTAVIDESSPVTVADTNTNAMRELALAAPQVLLPGLYYAGLVCSATASLMCHSVQSSQEAPGGDFVLPGGSLIYTMPGVYKMAHAFGAMPATVTIGTNSGDDSDQWPILALKVN